MLDFMSSRREGGRLDSHAAVFSLWRRTLMRFRVPLFTRVLLLRHPRVIVRLCLLCCGLAERCCASHLTQQKD